MKSVISSVMKSELEVVTRVFLILMFAIIPNLIRADEGRPAENADSNAAATGDSVQESPEELVFAPVPARGNVEFQTTALESEVPKQFQLNNHRFSFDTTPHRTTGDIHIHKVTFPSPVVTDVEENNTVHGMYFQPPGPGPFPGVVVLHILGGDFILSQTVANSLARKGVAALFIKLPYYGERRSPRNPRRLMSKDVKQTVEGMTQGVLDIRQSIAWLKDRSEVDDHDLGITGISLGGLMSALGAVGEPRIRKVGIQLAGGNLAATIWDKSHKEAEGFREDWEAKGGTRDTFLEVVAPIDPTTYGHLLKGRKVMMLAARQDEIFSVNSTLSLWKSMGEEPELIWLEDVGHYTALLYIMRETERLGEFLKKPLDHTQIRRSE